jgi:precorrin-2 dehydrogenase/sirohydrochlorin ferrochelatase
MSVLNRAYPVFLNLEGKRCLVVGGGNVAERKVKALLKSGTQVTILSPTVTVGLRKLVRSGGLEHLRREYVKGDLRGFYLVIAATDDLDTNRRIVRDARGKNLLLNVVDQPELCNFFVPAVAERGDLKIAISTGGKSPALARKIRKELQKTFGGEYTSFLKLLGVLRTELKRRYPRDARKRKAILNRLVYSDVLLEIKKGRRFSLEDLEKWIS